MRVDARPWDRSGMKNVTLVPSLAALLLVASGPLVAGCAASPRTVTETPPPMEVPLATGWSLAPRGAPAASHARAAEDVRMEYEVAAIGCAGLPGAIEAFFPQMPDEALEPLVLEAGDRLVRCGQWRDVLELLAWRPQGAKLLGRLEDAGHDVLGALADVVGDRVMPPLRHEPMVMAQVVDFLMQRHRGAACAIAQSWVAGEARRNVGPWLQHAVDACEEPA